MKSPAMSPPFTAFMLLWSVLMFVSLAGCASTSPSNSITARVAIQYATLRLIEDSDGITADGVINHVQIVRGMLAENSVMPVSDIAARILQSTDIARLDPPDRLLVETLVLQVQAVAESAESGATGNSASMPVDANTRTSLMMVLAWIEQAARSVST
jgi:hypothetical protein